MKRFFNTVTVNPVKLFAIDGLGAFLTAFFLFAILKTNSECFGMTMPTLRLLSTIALLFSVYSFACYFLANKNWQPFLLTIGILNTLYCCLTLGLIVYNYPQLTLLGIIYFLTEISILCGLIYLEINALIISRQTKQNDHPTRSTFDN